MLRRYEIQVAELSATLKKEPPTWLHVAYRATERACRKAWWAKVNTYGLRIYRMVDTKTGRVIEP